MAHRVLAAKLAEQLTEANARVHEAQVRIINLETAVADCEARLESSDTNAQPVGEYEAQRASLIQDVNTEEARTAKLDETLTRMVQVVEKYNIQVKEAADLREREAAAAAARIIELKRELANNNAQSKTAGKDKSELSPALGNQAAELKAWCDQLAITKTNLESQVAQSKLDLKQLKSDTDQRDCKSTAEMSRLSQELKAAQYSGKLRCKENEQLQATEARVRGELVASGAEVVRLLEAQDTLREKLVAANAKVASFTRSLNSWKAKEAAQRQRADALKVNESSLRRELAEESSGSPNCGALVVYGQDARSKNALNGGRGRGEDVPARMRSKDRQIIALKAELAKTQTQHGTERKRRLEAEALLGPDGKRCKKCNPVVINLEDDESSHASNAAVASNESTVPQPKGLLRCGIASSWRKRAVLQARGDAASLLNPLSAVRSDVTIMHSLKRVLAADTDGSSSWGISPD